MKFRPCIDIHDGKVKQIVGGSLFEKEGETSSLVKENFVAKNDSAFFAALYKEKKLAGGHIILLNKYGTDEYEADIEQAKLALNVYPGGLQIGGGITAFNAAGMLNLGASHVIVTSYVFKDGRINYENLELLRKEVGKEKIVLDLSCRKKDGKYYVVTDRWQKFTDEIVAKQLFDTLNEYCDEYLVHAVDVEGRAKGIEEDVAKLLGGLEEITATYAGGISSLDDLDKLKELGNDAVDFTVGSALDIFGGKLKFEEIALYK